ncbi:helitron helicase-like domain-containing protein [Acrocarpospora catenulata]|uniref:helitron helicase-like domain-containing protein n=1 Tax=Acrocarpospora catenulata TaxID=2836182 RepID=UPI002023B3D2|nr:helitron helicase-like domain-containing protein [Acrocarpospora catenulata]
MGLPIAREVVESIAVQNEVCIRPVPLRRIDTHTGASEIIDVPCGATLEAKCPSCAKRNRHLRVAQCREGWHLTEEPAITPGPADDYQTHLIEQRADFQAARDQAARDGHDTADIDLAIVELDEEINAAGVRGNVIGSPVTKRARSTRRRQDAPDLPKRTMARTTLGRVFRSPHGKVFRPSMFLTLTLPSYGKVKDGVPVDPDRYDYTAAARDALHFSKLVDRFVQNLRRVAGFDVQYFATVEPQKRLAPHLHMAIRGTLPRAELRQIVAATYHQVWWPPLDTVRFEASHLPVWEDGAGYLDPDTGEVLPTWDEALDQLDRDPDAEPVHVVRFGQQLDLQGVLAGTKDADQCIRYLSKYLTKSLGRIPDPDHEGQRRHAERLGEAVRLEPCSASCANWLRYGVQPKNAKPGMTPGRCTAKAHRPEHLGYAGRRVLVSRKWSNKTLTEHKQDRRTWAMQALGIPEDPADPHRYTWRPIPNGDANLPPISVRLLRAVHERQRWRNHMTELQTRADDQDPSATQGMAA